MYSKLLTKVSTHNTYIETISNKADGLHYHIEKNYIEIINKEYTEYVKKIIVQERLGTSDIIVDITHDNFYGKTTGLYIHNWTGEKGVRGKFLYIVACIKFRNKILPFYVMMLRVGAFKAEYLGKIVEICNSMRIIVRAMILDRGFYSGEVIDELELRGVNYLILVPKNQLFKCMLEGTDKSAVVKHEIKYSKDKSTFLVDTNIALVKNVNDYDWVFASNMLFDNNIKYVKVYKQRWNIETMFRVHDEAKIKSKSVNPVVRLFYFMMSLLFLLVWNLYAKSLFSFKNFIILLADLLDVVLNVTAN